MYYNPFIKVYKLIFPHVFRSPSWWTRKEACKDIFNTLPAWRIGDIPTFARM